MSSALYALGRWAARAKWLVLTVWLVVLAVLAAGALTFGKGADAPISIPGTEAQDAITSLSHTFPEVSGTSATIIVVSPTAGDLESGRYRSAVESVVGDLEALPGVSGVLTPFGTGDAAAANTEISPDGRALLVRVQVDGEMTGVAQETIDGIAAASDELREALPGNAEVAYGGEMFSAAVPSLSPTEAIGVVIAFVVLILTLGSLIAAGMPLLIALIGVGVSIAGLFFVTAFVDLTSTTPMLALMLGLAVGIDYTLFIVSRHQEQLRAGLSVRESIARATATSGSAVVFAGLTVIIALVGLAVARIPFLTALGVAAAAAVAVAVLIAITLTPAVLSMVGMRILPRKHRPASEAAAETAGDAGHGQAEAATVTQTRADRFFAGWVRGATKRPIFTIVAVLIVLGVGAIPALQLRLALPDATSLAVDDPARVTHELTGEHFGEGFNAPLLLTGSIISSTDPLGLMDDLKREVEQVPGVAEVPLATPNPGADTGIIQVIPEEGAHAASTTALVQELRDRHDEWEDTYGVSLAVTGFTAIGIDVSAQLMSALLPFGIFVVGLSLVLLAMVFRSVWVPIKATLGYLLSVGVAFGAVVAVFQWGWLADALHVSSTGPVLSFMPIILMGVLFGLAMDYEVFLVARMREEYVHGGDAQRAIHRGFVGSAKVVTAAALIMIAVFAAFVPAGDPSIKVIALGLAVGVFVDAFIVRMTLVPAVLALLGDRAWQMPRWLARVLPSFDVEGEGLAREIAHATWPADMPDARVASSRLTLRGRGANVVTPEVRLGAGDALVLDQRNLASLPLAQALSGRGRIVAGTLKVGGLLLPERASSLRARAAWADPDTLRQALRDAPELLVLDLREAEIAPLSPATLADVRSALAAWRVERGPDDADPILIVLGDPALAGRVLPTGQAAVAPPTDLAERLEMESAR
ncbi:MMPL family transporter [Leucobacter komagatae]|uniref:MMPL family transporter n=1 Tax=Leucobacter komagatae TaxID=55969 RepID=UPI0005ACF70E|nr:MMPL family transporter [Leucobacter komagatae]